MEQFLLVTPYSFDPDFFKSSEPILVGNFDSIPDACCSIQCTYSSDQPVSVHTEDDELFVNPDITIE